LGVLVSRFKILLLIFVTGLFFRSETSFAWADMGHSIIGAVAEENIKPSTKDFVRGILGVEPMEVAAIWADHVRDDDRFGHKNRPPLPILEDDHNFADYHFCEIPAGYTYSNRPNKDIKDCYGAIAGAKKILEGKSGRRSHAEKLIALRYLIHVVGDLHQPLHVGNGFDLGANACQILWQKTPSSKPVQYNMHSFWDDNIVQYLGETYADPSKKRKAAIYLNDYMKDIKEHRPEMFTESAKLQYGQGSVEQWLDESAKLRESGVYPDDPALMKGVPVGQEYKSRPYCQWFTDQENSVVAPGSVIDFTKLPVIRSDYMNKFVPIVETQLLKGGLRLATLLDEIADSAANSGARHSALNDERQEKILSRIQRSFENEK
jgi:hypothetical protein